MNTRAWLTDLPQTLNQRTTLDDVPDSELDRFADPGCDWIWLLSVRQTGEALRRVSQKNAQWRHEFEQTLPDLSDADLSGSGSVITEYTVHQSLGGDRALARFRSRLKERGLKLMLDFVPHYTALDHAWVEEHPEYFVPGTELDLARAPQNDAWARRKRGDVLRAQGRAPDFSGWPDTLQLDYSNPVTQEAMLGELTRISGQCDGVRCDMAMLILSHWSHPERRSGASATSTECSTTILKPTAVFRSRKHYCSGPAPAAAAERTPSCRRTPRTVLETSRRSLVINQTSLSERDDLRPSSIKSLTHHQRRVR